MPFWIEPFRYDAQLDYMEPCRYTLPLDCVCPVLPTGDGLVWAWDIEPLVRPAPLRLVLVSNEVADA